MIALAWVCMIGFYIFGTLTMLDWFEYSATLMLIFLLLWVAFGVGAIRIRRMQVT